MKRRKSAKKKTSKQKGGKPARTPKQFALKMSIRRKRPSPLRNEIKSAHSQLSFINLMYWLFGWD